MHYPPPPPPTTGNLSQSPPFYPPPPRASPRDEQHACQDHVDVASPSGRTTSHVSSHSYGSLSNSPAQTPMSPPPSHTASYSATRSVPAFTDPQVHSTETINYDQHRSTPFKQHGYDGNVDHDVARQGLQTVGASISHTATVPLAPVSVPFHRMNDLQHDDLAGDAVGTFNGGSYRISHRTTNSVLTLNLAIGCPVTAKPGSMAAMSTTVTLKGSLRPSLKKLIAGGGMSQSTFTGPGEVVLAPACLGDIIAIVLDGPETWYLGTDAFLACTQGIHKDHKRQRLSQALYSGQGLYTYIITGMGLLWITSFGAIIQKVLLPDETYIVDNKHLVAWTATYVMERGDASLISGLSSQEGLVCKFTGPGVIYYQTRNLYSLTASSNP